MIAAFPMYDRPELRAAHAAFWSNIKSELGYGPDTLAQPADLWAFWRAPDLVLGQTCGLPFRAKLWRDVHYVTTPDYQLPDCPAGYYNSVLLVRDDAPLYHLSDLTGKTFAYNEALSQSGWAGPISYLQHHGVTPKHGVPTGAHLNSIAAVIAGQADFCAVDAQTYRLFQRYDGAASGLREIARTDPTPALPMICAHAYDPAQTAAALRKALDHLSTGHRQDLGIAGYVTLDVATYRNVNTPQNPEQVFDNL